MVIMIISFQISRIHSFCGILNSTQRQILCTALTICEFSIREPRGTWTVSQMHYELQHRTSLCKGHSSCSKDNLLVHNVTRTTKRHMYNGHYLSLFPAVCPQFGISSANDTIFKIYNYDSLL